MPPATVRLTHREKEVVAGIAQGLNLAEVAAGLRVREATAPTQQRYTLGRFVQHRYDRAAYLLSRTL